MAVMDTGIQFVLGIVFIGIVCGVGLITLAAFSASSTNAVVTAGINNSTYGLLLMTSQLPTVGTIMGVSLILIVLFAALGFLVMRKE
jgi:hypothetical protein